MRVLLALDLGPSSEALVDRAAAWAARVGGTVHLRSISRLMGDAEAIVGSLETSFVAEDWEARRRWERQRVEQLALRLPGAVRGSAAVTEGHPEQVLVELSEIAELLVLGTHGRTGIARLFQGSVAEAVVRSARCPVLVLPLPEEGAEVDATLPDTLRVFCPVDVEEGELAGADWVRDHLGPVAFEIGHVLRYAPWLTRDLEGEPTLWDHPDARIARARLDDLAAVHELETSRTHLALAKGDNPGEQLAGMAGDLRADLIALPTHGRTGLARLILGSVTARVLRSARCPVLVTHMG